MKLTQHQAKTLLIISQHSSADPITSKEVANRIGLKERDSGKEGADMRSIINALRTKGHPICANGKGCFWPANKYEVENYIASFQGRIDQQQKACSGMKQGVKAAGMKIVKKKVVDFYHMETDLFGKELRVPHYKEQYVYES